jgi:anti-sigma regulatory factor (Ser/Thr protein kinase)
VGRFAAAAALASSGARRGRPDVHRLCWTEPGQDRPQLERKRLMRHNTRPNRHRHGQQQLIGKGRRYEHRGLCSSARRRGWGGPRRRLGQRRYTRTPEASVLTAPATEPSLSPSLGSISLPGGERAPALARKHSLVQLNGAISHLRASDAALIVSELVTNSVLHANVGIDQALFLELTMLADHLRIAVSDPGSPLKPRLMPVDPAVPGGRGLQLVDQLCSAWGVTREAVGTTCVWCDLPVERAERIGRSAG